MEAGSKISERGKECMLKTFKFVNQSCHCTFIVDENARANFVLNSHVMFCIKSHLSKTYLNIKIVFHTLKDQAFYSITASMEL